MRIWGKVLGFLFGFMLSKNLFGALLGLWLGHMFDRSRGFDFDGLSQGEEDDVSRQAVFFYTASSPHSELETISFGHAYLATTL